MNIEQAILQRQSIRAYEDRAVDREIIRSILDVARWTPSGVNTQPWQIEVVTGASKQTLSAAILAARETSGTSPDYDYYPEQWREPYKARRKACGLALYGALEIGRDDKQKAIEAANNNFRFFDAPVGMFFFMDRDMGQGSWLDMGMMLQSIMLLAKQHGLDTCPQASLAENPDVVRQQLGVGDDKLLVCGLSMGYAQQDAAVNQYRTERLAVDEFTHWHE